MAGRFLVDDDRFHDRCGLFGVFGHPEAANITYLGLYALQHRGQKSAGIVTAQGDALRLEKGMGLSTTCSTRRGCARCPAVLSAVGLMPRTGLAKAAGISVKRGIVADRFLATSAPDVFALGDCAEVEGLCLPYVMPIMHAARALAKTLAGTPAAAYPAMPVIVKTPAAPAVVSPPATGAAGQWRIDASKGVEARFEGADGSLLGYALVGAATAARQALAAKLPPVLESAPRKAA